MPRSSRCRFEIALQQGQKGPQLFDISAQGSAGLRGSGLKELLRINGYSKDVTGLRRRFGAGALAEAHGADIQLWV